MGCNQSKIENEEAVARCKERKRFMKDAVSSRNAFAAAHSSYATCLKNTGAALGDFAPGEVQNPQLHSNDTNASFPNPQPFEIPLPPPPLPDFSPAPPLQRAISMPEMKINKPDPRPRPEPVGTIVEEEDEEDKELENEGSLRKRRSNNRVNSNKRVSEEEQQPRPPMPPPPVKQPEPRDHVTHHQHSMAQDTQSGAWEYFFPSFENIAGPSLNAAEEDAVSKVHEVERKVFDEKPRVVEEIDDEVVTPVRGVEVPEPEPEPEPVPEPPAVPDEMMETPVGKGVKLKQTPSSVEGKRIVKHSVNLQQIFADLDDNFLKASEAAHDVSKMLEATRLHYHSNFADNKGHIDHSARVMRVITWNRSFKGIPNVDDGKDDFDSDEHETHATILDKLLAWEKKLYDEVKAGELMKFEYQRKVAALNKLKKRGTNSEALEKAKAVVSHLHTRYIVDMQSLDSTVSEINRLRDEQLYPRLVQLVDGMAEMWKLMLEYHEKQSDTVKLLKTLDISQSTKQTSEHHHDRTYQLLLVVQQWHSQFEMLVNHQKGYIKSLNTWLKLNLIPIESSLKEKVSSPPRVRSAPIQGLLHAWNDRLEKLPDELARTAIGNFVAVIETIFHQQEEEIALKRKCEDTRKELSRKTRQFEDWYNKYMQKKIPDEYNPDTAEDSNGPDEAVTERQVAVEQVKKRLEDEEEAYARQCRQVRAKTMGSLTNRMPELFRAMSDFSLECSKMYSELRSISQNLGQSSS
ncbi:nitrate regulatory gene2 protein [Vigna radiata var. radiata]|uniref:Nitrate regulatory gene2 protein n=1 Tax=Vigna radiata var. radiata TaxID=3916 RepID=A0A1S3U5F0_VIGRR|nr:nitrate regulatory gene2 protein [Vigna radiata var. radiata]